MVNKKFMTYCVRVCSDFEFMHFSTPLHSLINVRDQ